MLVVLSASDIRNCFQKRISGKQLFKNVATLAGGLAGGAAAGVLGTIVLGVVTGGASTAITVAVSVAAGAAGGAAGSKAVNSVVGHFIEDDAVALCQILEESFCQQVENYLLSEEELDILLGSLNQTLEQEALLEMYASPDHRAFADELIQKQIEKLLRQRCHVYLPNEKEFIQGMGKVFTDIETESGIFSSRTRDADAVAIGQTLTGKTLSPLAAKKGLYAARQMNLTQSQTESRIRKMSQNEKICQRKLDTIHGERDAMKRELDELLGGSLA